MGMEDLYAFYHSGRSSWHLRARMRFVALVTSPLPAGLASPFAAVAFLAGAFLAVFLVTFLAGAFLAAFLVAFLAGAFLVVFLVVDRLAKGEISDGNGERRKVKV